MAGCMAEKWRTFGKAPADDKGNANELYWYRPKVGEGFELFLNDLYGGVAGTAFLRPKLC